MDYEEVTPDDRSTGTLGSYSQKKLKEDCNIKNGINWFTGAILILLPVILLVIIEEGIIVELPAGIENTMVFIIDLLLFSIIVPFLMAKSLYLWKIENQTWKIIAFLAVAGESISIFLDYYQHHMVSITTPFSLTIFSIVGLYLLNKAAIYSTNAGVEFYSSNAFKFTRLILALILLVVATILAIYIIIILMLLLSGDKLRLG